MKIISFQPPTQNKTQKPCSRRMCTVWTMCTANQRRAKFVFKMHVYGVDDVNSQGMTSNHVCGVDGWRACTSVHIFSLHKIAHLRQFSITRSKFNHTVRMVLTSRHKVGGAYIARGMFSSTPYTGGVNTAMIMSRFNVVRPLTFSQWRRLRLSNCDE